MQVWAGKVAVVTGASAGIGAAIALDLAKAGLHVVGLARRRERIEELATKAAKSPGKIHAVECDVSNTESVVKTFKWIKEKFGKVHILINNAGRTKFGNLLDAKFPHEEVLSTININISGLVVCTREAYKLMESHEEPGYIININSVAGHITPAAMMIPTNVYSATKHAVTNHTDQLRLELATSGNKRIRVSSLSPGAVKTEFGEAAGFDLKTFDVEKMATLEAQDISDAVLYLLSLPASVNVSELTIKPTGEMF